MNVFKNILKVTQVGNSWDFLLGSVTQEFLDMAGNAPEPIDDIVKRFLPEEYKYFTENNFQSYVNRTGYRRRLMNGTEEESYVYSIHYITDDKQLATFTILKMGL